jgi:multiple sugar transport system ATP-binding protein
MALVKLEKITKVYPGGVVAVDGMDLQIADQEFVVLVGPSGCGKTTTLRMIAGLEEITSGELRIGGRVVNHVPPKDRDIAMVFQNYALYPHMTVERNMSFSLRMRMLPGPLWQLWNLAKARDIKRKIRQRVSNAARILEIEHLLHRKPRELSGGQRQRVAVGRAIVREPAAFLFDEPLSNLDAKLRVTTRAELKRLHRRLKTTTVYVTHDQEEAMTLGDRIVVMKDGVIQQADTPLETYNSPANRFVAGFIGMPPMNFFDGFVQQRDGREIFVEAARRGSDVRSAEAGFEIPLSPSLVDNIDKLNGQPNRQVVLGIRPGHFLACPSESSAPIPLRLNVIEPLGGDMDLYASTRFHEQIVARVPAQSDLHVDTSITLHADLRKIQLFAPGETGVNLGRRSELAHAT